MIFASLTKPNISDFKWDLAYTAFVVLISLLFFKNRKVKGGFVFLGFTLPPTALSVLIRFYVKEVVTNPDAAISLGVACIPTIGFITCVYYYVLFGLWRGFRKSALFLLHSVCAAAVCIGLYFFFAKSSAFDRFALKAVNFFMGGDGALQSQLSVSAECSGIKQVLTEWLPSQFGYGTEIGIILADNGAYLATLADIACSVAYAFIAVVLYEILIFILWIVYHIAYPERRYRRKKESAFAQKKTDRNYKKHSLGGGAIGLLRGIAAGVFSLSLCGGVMFTVVGSGNGGNGALLGNLAVGDDIMYAVYRSADEYGSNGIYKVLNAFTDPDGSPYYLFALDTVFSGRLKDERNGINQTIKLRKELSAYADFASDTVDLLIAHGGEEIKSVIKGGEGATDKIIAVMQKPEFQTEFEALIDGFDSQTYIINFALSAANSIVSHIDEMSFASGVSERNRELIKLLFKQGYLCESIPEERDALNSGKTEDNNLPYIGINKLFNKQDAKTVYKSVLSLLSSGDDADTLEKVRNILPQISSLSIFQTKRQNEFNPVFGRLYCYLANEYLSDGGSEVTYKEITDSQVPWVSEINSLLTVAENGLELYNSVKNSSEESTVNKLLSLFDEDGENYERNITLYDGVTDVVSNSKLISKVLNTDYIYNMLKKLFSSVNEDMYVPNNIRYENHAGEGGTEYGELYQFLSGIRLLGSKQNRELINKAVSGEIEDLADMLDLVCKSAQSKDSLGKTLAAYMTDSVLIRSLISSVLIGRGGDTLYIPQTVLQTDENGNCVNLIDASTIAGLFDGFTDEEIKDSVVSFINGEMEVTDLVNNDKVFGLLMSRNGIIEGTVSKLLIDTLKDNEFVVLPAALADPENLDGWISYKSVDGELCKLATALNKIKIDLNADSDDKKKEIMDKLLALSAGEIDALFNSDVMYYTVSETLCNSNGGESNDILELGEGLKLLVPNSVKQKAHEGDSVKMLILKSEIKAMFKQASELNLTSDAKTDTVLCQIVKNSDHIGNSMIISATIANFMCNQANGGEKNVLTIPKKFKEMGEEERLIKNTGREVQAWQREIVLLADALDIVFGITENDSTQVELDKVAEYLDKLSEEFNVEVSRGVTKLDVCCESEIMMYNVSDYLDKNVFGKWRTGANAINGEYFDRARNDEGIYPKEEIKALVNALTVFGITEGGGNITKINASDLKNNAVKNIVELNQPCIELNEVTHLDRTGLDYIYPSVILTSLITDEIDRAFADRTDEELRLNLKTANGVYKKEELKACVDALGVLDIKDGDLNNMTAEFDSVTLLAEHLDVLYSSRLIANSITRAVKSAITPDGVLVHHNKAYENGSVYLYKKAEIEALIGLIDGGKVGEFKLGGIADITAAVLDGSNIKSYLIAASITKNAVQNENLIVPYSQIGTDGVLKAAELKAFLTACRILCGDGALGEWTAEFNELPPDEVLNSDIIRATLTYIITQNNTSDSGLTVSADNVKSFNRAKISGDGYAGNIAYSAKVTRTQMEATFKVLRALSSPDKPFEVPEITLAKLAELNENGNLAEFLDCDVIRYRASDVIHDAAQRMALLNPEALIWYNDNAEIERTVNLNGVSFDGSGNVLYAESRKLSKEAILEFIERFE